MTTEFSFVGIKPIDSLVYLADQYGFYILSCTTQRFNIPYPLQESSTVAYIGNSNNVQRNSTYTFGNILPTTEYVIGLKSLEIVGTCISKRYHM